MKVEAILRGKGNRVVSVRPDLPVISVAQRLKTERIGAVVVSADDRRVLGMLSERDIVHALATQGERAMGLVAADLMTRTVITCAPDDTVGHLMQVMTQRRIRHLPVLRDGVLVGLVSIGDVVKNRIEESEMETRVLRDAYIAAR